jgi:N-acetylmuramoyl-L-alanine amidase
MAKIGLDPGHGGKDSGAIGPTGLYEKIVTLGIALEVERLLEQAGHQVVMTRVKDEGLSLDQRVTILNNTKCDIAVSIHTNSFSKPEPNYITTFIQGVGGQAEKIAKCVQPRLVQASGWPDGGIRVANLQMTRETKMPAILVELGFISNPEQEKQLVQPEFQKKLASAIASGLLDYMGEPLKNPCTIRIKGKDFPGYIVGGKSYFGEGVAVREVVNAMNLSLTWDSKAKRVNIV